MKSELLRFIKKLSDLIEFTLNDIVKTHIVLMINQKQMCVKISDIFLIIEMISKSSGFYHLFLF